MEEICKNCWNEGCKAKEELRLSKVDVCKDMHENPEKWDFDDAWHPEEYEWQKGSVNN